MIFFFAKVDEIATRSANLFWFRFLLRFGDKEPLDALKPALLLPFHVGCRTVIITLLSTEEYLEQETYHNDQKC